MNGQGFVQNKVFNKNYRSHPNLSYRSTNVENPQDQVYPEQVVGQSQNRFQGGFQQKQPLNNFQTSYNSEDNSQTELKGLMQQLLLNQQKSTDKIQRWVICMLILIPSLKVSQLI